MQFSFIHSALLTEQTLPIGEQKIEGFIWMKMIL
jgi:hypothetical protein